MSVAAVVDASSRSLEWELDSSGNRTGRYRKRQFYARPMVNGVYPRLPPSRLVACEFREPKP